MITNLRGLTDIHCVSLQRIGAPRDMKTLTKKWYLLTFSVVLLIAMLGISATAVAAADPPQPVNSLVKCYFGNNGTGTNSYVDVTLNGGQGYGAPLSSWCANEHININVGQEYVTQIYDYFGSYYPDYINPPYLPPSVITNAYTGTPINWFGIAYILNHKTIAGIEASPDAVQAALWYYSDGDTSFSCFTNGSFTAYPTHPPLVLPQDQEQAIALIAAAEAYLAANGNVYIPGPGEIKPMVCYIDVGTQLLIFEYRNDISSPPLPELPAGALLGLGLLGLGGVGWFGYRKSRASTTSV